MRRWKRLRIARSRQVLVGALACLLAGLLVYELYRIIVPFQTLNPLWSEATVNEPVIDDWRYGGENEEGYLIFYNQYNRQTELPPGDKMLALDGKFVMIERASPNSLVYARPAEAVPAEWWLILAGGAAVAACAVILRSRLRRRVPARTFPLGGHRARPGGNTLKRRRFRAARAWRR